MLANAKKANGNFELQNMYCIGSGFHLSQE